jgi:cell division protein FtsQ
MAINVNIRKLLFVMLWCVAGAGMVLLLGASINHRNGKTCQGYKIDISGSGGDGGLFIDRKEVERLLAAASGAVPHTGAAGSVTRLDASTLAQWKGRHIMSFDLRHMESALEKNAWIRDAELFFDNNGILRVNVIEREPIARIFTTAGNSFYIDSSGAELPLSARLPAKLPVFTGFPAQKPHLHGDDSVLAVQVRKLSGFIRKDPFWMAQIAQIDITPSRTFEMVPLIGDHFIAFGDGNDYEQKFHRLFIFYREVLSRTGFDKYSRIDVHYAGQVIGTRKGSEETHTDSLQGMQNIRQLIRTAQQLQPDTARQRNMKPLERSVQTEQTLTGYDLVPGGADSAEKKTIFIKHKQLK